MGGKHHKLMSKCWHTNVGIEASYENIDFGSVGLVWQDFIVLEIKLSIGQDENIDL